MAQAESDMQFVIEDEDGEREPITLPAGLVEALAESGEASAETVADIALMAFVGRAHALVHHAEGEPDPAIEAAEERALELFEERFGMTYAEATGHSH